MVVCLYYWLLTRQSHSQTSPSLSSLVSPTRLKTDQEKLADIAHSYCHQSLLKTVTGSEGMLQSSNADMYKLVQVHVLLRHGDRSQASDLRVNPPVRYECGMVDRDERWSALQDITRVPHPSTATVMHLHNPLFRGYQHQSCGSGQLTLIGFKQHRQLGMFMHDRYAELIQSVTNDKDVFVQSTDFQRTIDSAAAFLLGFHSKPSHLKKLPIHVSKDINLHMPPPRLVNNYPKCKKLGAIWKRELANQPRNDQDVQTFHRLATILDIGNYNIRMTDLYDLIWCRMCHNNTLPCGASGCPNTKLWLEGARSAYRAFTHLYPITLSIVKVQGYLANTVIGAMEHAVHVMNTGSYVKMTLSFAHDSVLAPVLHSLGAAQSVWLPYASRVVIEFWQVKNIPVDGDTPYYVRLLYNGVSISHQVAGVAPADLTADSQLITYTAWKQYLLTGPIRSLNSYRTTCGF